RHQVDWTMASNQVEPTGNYVILELTPATWYNLRINAHNNAGASVAEYEVATFTVTGGVITEIPAKVAPDECYNMNKVPCSEFPEGENFPHPTHCNKFFKCVGGHVVVKTCHSGKLYNHLTGWC
ncbi:unnamed protein product, partial [Meganyctiphanes norvegica]